MGTPGHWCGGGALLCYLQGFTFCIAWICTWKMHFVEVWRVGARMFGLDLGLLNAFGGGYSRREVNFP